MSAKDYVEKDYYQVLGVPKDAPAAEIKKVYRKLARKYHPDANKGDAGAEERFKEISEAYDVLADPARRKEYDEARELFGSGGFRMPGGGGSAGPGGFPFDLSDLFGQNTATSSVGDFFGGLFGARASRAAPRRGSDIESEVTLNFTDAIDGAVIPLRMTGPQPCQACGGSGAKPGSTPRVCPACSGSGQTSRNQGGFAFSEPCRECRGRGFVVDEQCPDCLGSGRATSAKTTTVRIPPGVRDGQRIRLKGKGVPGERGGMAGDLYVVVHLRPHPVFGRQGDNLTITVPVTFPEAALGAEVKVPTLGGVPVTVRLPAGTPNGRTFRVRGRGALRKDGARGDLLVTAEVVVPRKLSSKAREALARFQESTPDEDPRADLLALAKGE